MKHKKLSIRRRRITWPCHRVELRHPPRGRDEASEEGT
jgi:hypothetical protein